MFVMYSVICAMPHFHETRPSANLAKLPCLFREAGWAPGCASCNGESKCYETPYMPKAWHVFLNYYCNFTINILPHWCLSVLFKEDFISFQKGIYLFRFCNYICIILALVAYIWSDLQYTALNVRLITSYLYMWLKKHSHYCIDHIFNQGPNNQ